MAGFLFLVFAHAPFPTNVFSFSLVQQICQNPSNPIPNPIPNAIPNLIPKIPNPGTSYPLNDFICDTLWKQIDKSVGGPIYRFVSSAHARLSLSNPSWRRSWESALLSEFTIPSHSTTSMWSSKQLTLEISSVFAVRRDHSAGGCWVCTEPVSLLCSMWCAGKIIPYPNQQFMCGCLDGDVVNGLNSHRTFC